MTYFNILLNLYYEINIFKGNSSIANMYDLQCHYYNYWSYKTIISIQSTWTRDFATVYKVYMRKKLKINKNTFHRDGKFINEY